MGGAGSDAALALIMGLAHLHDQQKAAAANDIFPDRGRVRWLRKKIPDTAAAPSARAQNVTVAALWRFGGGSLSAPTPGCAVPVEAVVGCGGVRCWPGRGPSPRSVSRSPICRPRLGPTSD